MCRYLVKMVPNHHKYVFLWFLTITHDIPAKYEGKLILAILAPFLAILTTFAREFFLGTSKIEIYIKKQAGNRRQMVVLGGGVWDHSGYCTITELGL